MTDIRHPEDPVVGWLESLAARSDRGALAALRASLREGRTLDALRVVLPVLGRQAGTQRENDAVLLAGLFGLHPVSGSLSIASALRLVAVRSGSGSIEARFRALLASSREDLPSHLRHAVSLVAGSNIGVDWAALHRSIRYWDHDADFVRRQWARDFWASDPFDSAVSTDTDHDLPAEDASDED